jgi:hypothetical protein
MVIIQAYRGSASVETDKVETLESVTKPLPPGSYGFMRFS